MKTSDFKLNLTRPLCVFDLETTGLRIGIDRIVEIGILKAFPDGHVEEFNRRVNPEMPIPPESSSVHHIYDADVALEPTFKALAPKIVQFIGNSDLAGFNSNKFDVPVLVEDNFCFQYIIVIFRIFPVSPLIMNPVQAFFIQFSAAAVNLRPVHNYLPVFIPDPCICK